jgi:alpha-tubulin suppressor-like RCC1 family protein
MNRNFHTAVIKWFLVIFALLGVLLAACGGGADGGGSTVPAPAAPSNLQATDASSSVINLAWNDASNNEDGFKVYRGADSSTVTNLVATLGLGTTSYSNTGLAAATTYFYKVTAYNSAGESAASNVANATTNFPPVTVPAAPSNLQATAASSFTINLAWNDASSNEDGFKVYRGADSSTVTNLVATLGAGTTSYSNTGLAAATTYFYKVTAYNSAGESAASNVANATTNSPPVTVPAAPSNLQATVASSSTINLAWNDASSNEDGFRVYRGADSSTVTTIVATMGAGTTSYSNTGLAAATTYYYKVAAYNSAGESAASNVANATTNSPPVTVPATPSNLQATAASSTNINLAWTDASSNEDGFRVYRGTGSSPANFTQVGVNLGADVTTFADTTVSGSTTYVYRVVAFNSAGVSSFAQSSAVITPLGPISVDAGNRHSLALMSNGTVRAWGSNSEGQLGVGAPTGNSLIPIPIATLTGVSAISAGDTQSLALMSDGTMKGWGQNFFGEVGSGDNVVHYTPVNVLGLTGVSAISAGGFFSIALKNDGSVWAWGRNDVGQLGNGTTINRDTPVQVSGLTGMSAISAGQYHTLALKTDGTVWSWGLNDVGQLGNGTTTNSLVPVRVAGISGVAAISAGEAHSLLLLNDGTVWAWGDNYWGELGDGTSNNVRLTPVPTSGLNNVKAISAGGYFSIALKNDGMVWAWGSGFSGQMGDGTEDIARLTPVQVSLLTNVQAISNSEDQSLSLRGGINTLWAWGGNAYGQIGDGTTNDALVPVPVSGF